MVSPKPSLRDGETLNNFIWGLKLRLGDNILTDQTTEVTPSGRIKVRKTYNKTNATEALTLWYLLIQDEVVGTAYERVYSTANLLRIAGQLSDLLELNGQCKELLAFIRSFDPRMGQSGFRAYKAWYRATCVGEIADFLAPLVYSLYFGEQRAYLRLNNILQFLSRLTMDLPELEEEAVEAYLSKEQEMSEWAYPETLVDCLRFIVTSWLKDMSLDDMRPNFSAGATAEVKRGAGAAQKCGRGVTTPLLLSASALASWSQPYMVTFDALARPTAIWASVPKGLDRRRGISMEPTANQYLEKGLFDRFDEWFSTHPELRIDLHDQDLSRAMALRGSKTFEYATADLSNASDTITWKLVRELLRDMPTLLWYVSAVRTELVDVKGTEIAMAKYAPMGSSLCFPMECIVFSACASYACWLTGIPQNYRVYGDDIVIDCRAYAALVDVLTRLHFEVNVEKSYSYSIFTEACGIECYDGHDVTPIRLSRRFNFGKSFTLSPQQLDNLVDLANKFYAYGCFKARKFLVQQILAIYSLVPFSVNPETGIYHPDPTNAHLPSRRYTTRRRTVRKQTKISWFGTVVAKREWRFDIGDTDYQSGCVQCYALHTATEKGNDWYRYQLTLEATELRIPYTGELRSQWVLTPDERVEVRCGKTRSSLRKKWVPLDDLLHPLQARG